MKPIKLFIFLAMATALLSSCGSSSSSDAFEGCDYIPVQIDEDGKWGMIDKDGKALFSDEFKSEPTVAINGLFSVKEGDSYALYKAEKKPVLVPGCDDLLSVGVYREGVIPVTHPKGRIMLIDDAGKEKATLNPIGGKEIIASGVGFVDGLLNITTEEDLMGMVDKSGKVVIEPKFSDLGVFSEGLAYAEKIINDETTRMYINKKGAEVFRVKKNIQLIDANFTNGLIPAKDDDGRCGFINKKGEFNKTGSKVSHIGEYNNKYFAFMNDEGLWGLMDMESNVMIRAKYGMLSFLSNGNFVVKDDNDYLVLNEKGDKIIEISDYSYLMLSPMNGSFAFIGCSGNRTSYYTLLDLEGKPVTKEEFHNIGSDISKNRYINTDYFNVDAVVQNSLATLTNEGFGKFRLGQPATALNLESADQYLYSYSYTDENLSFKGWRFEGELRISTSESIATREYDSFYNSTAVFNPEAKISEMQLVVSTNLNCWNDVKVQLIAGIEAKGYKLIDSGDEWANFKGKDCELRLNSDYHGFVITISKVQETEMVVDIITAVENEPLDQDSVLVVAVPAY